VSSSALEDLGVERKLDAFHHGVEGAQQHLGLASEQGPRRVATPRG
jgi:hypothetical protein